MKKRFLSFFSHFIEQNKVQDTFFDGLQGLFDICFAIDEVFSLGRKRSIARNFSKISCSHGDKSFWLTFQCIINCDKPPGTVYKCPQDFLTNTVEVKNIFFRTWEVVENTIFEKKTSNVSSEEKFMAPFFSFYRVSQASKNSLQGYSRFFRHYYVCYKINSLGPRRLLKTHFFERNANFPVKKSFWPNRPPIIESDKPQGTVNISSEARVTITLEKLRSFLLDLRGCWRHNFLKKKGNSSSEEKFLV